MPGRNSNYIVPRHVQVSIDRQAAAVRQAREAGERRIARRLEVAEAEQRRLSDADIIIHALSESEGASDGDS